MRKRPAVADGPLPVNCWDWHEAHFTVALTALNFECVGLNGDAP